MVRDTVCVWAVFVGSVIGAGFASGAETVTFFSVYGTSGLVGALVAGAVLAVLGARLMLIARNIETKDAVLRLLFGRASAFVSSLFIVFWLTMLAVMLAGAGALGASFGLSEHFGSGALAVFLYVLSLGGARALPLANMVVTPLVILVVGGAAAASLIYHHDHLLPMIELSSVPIPLLTDCVYYASYNLAMCLPALTSLPTMRPSAIRLGAVLAGATLSSLLVALFLVVMLHYEEAVREPIPMLMVAEMQDKSCYCGYALVLSLAMVTSALSALVGAASLCSPYVRSTRLCSAFLLALCFAVGMAGFTALTETALPMLGLVSLIFTIRLCLPVRGGPLRH